MPAVDTPGVEELRGRVGGNPLWYHTIDLGSGIVTPGWFDLRPVVSRMPWPDVRGMRCLDVGTYDGFLAFELERRGAREVVATDIDDHLLWDWLPEERAGGPQLLAELAGPERGHGFRIAADALGSSVERRSLSVYDLTPERVGTFELVVMGSLLLHLRDPMGALEAIRSVCEGAFLSAETIDLPLSRLHPRRPLARLKGVRSQWWVPNVAGHRRMLTVAGFSIARPGRPYVIPLGPEHPQRRRSRTGALRA